MPAAAPQAAVTSSPELVRWEDMTADPEYQTLDSLGRRKTFLNWKNYALGEMNKTGAWDADNYRDFRVNEARTKASFISPDVPVTDEDIMSRIEAEEAERDALLVRAEKQRRGMLGQNDERFGDAEMKLLDQVNRGKRDTTGVGGVLHINPSLYFKPKAEFAKAIQAEALVDDNEKARAIAEYDKWGKYYGKRRAKDLIRNSLDARKYSDQHPELMQKDENGEMEFGMDFVQAYQKDRNPLLSTAEAFAVGAADFGAEIPWAVAVVANKLGLEGVEREARDMLAEYDRASSRIQQSVTDSGDSGLLFGATRTITGLAPSMAAGFSAGAVGRKVAKSKAKSLAKAEGRRLTRDNAAKAIQSADELIAESLREAALKVGFSKKFSPKTFSQFAATAGFAAEGGAKSAALTYYEAYEGIREQLKEQGFKGQRLEKEALRRAANSSLRAGAVTSALTMAFGATGVEKMAKLHTLAKNPAAQGRLKDGVRTVLKEAGFEAGEEGLDEGINGAFDALEFNPDMTFDEFAFRVGFGASLGGLLGGVAATVSELSQPIQYDKPKEGAVSELEEKVEKVSEQVEKAVEVSENLRAEGRDELADAVDESLEKQAPEVAEELTAANSPEVETPGEITDSVPIDRTKEEAKLAEEDDVTDLLTPLAPPENDLLTVGETEGDLVEQLPRELPPVESDLETGVPATDEETAVDRLDIQQDEQPDAEPEVSAEEQPDVQPGEQTPEPDVSDTIESQEVRELTDDELLELPRQEASDFPEAARFKIRNSKDAEEWLRKKGVDPSVISPPNDDAGQGFYVFSADKVDTSTATRGRKSVYPNASSVYQLPGGKLVAWTMDDASDEIVLREVPFDASRITPNSAASLKYAEPSTPEAAPETPSENLEGQGADTDTGVTPFADSGEPAKLGDMAVGDTVRFERVPGVVYEITSTAPARLRVVESSNPDLKPGQDVSSAKNRKAQPVTRGEAPTEAEPTPEPSAEAPAAEAQTEPIVVSETDAGTTFTTDGTPEANAKLRAAAEDRDIPVVEQEDGSLSMTLGTEDAPSVGPVRNELGIAQTRFQSESTVTPEQEARHAELEAKYNAGTITPEETAEAQALVDEAAKAKGGIGIVFHGSADAFNGFSAGTLGRSTNASSAQLAHFFSTRSDVAEGFGDLAANRQGERNPAIWKKGIVRGFYLMSDIKRVDARGDINMVEELRSAKREGFDGVLFKDINDSARLEDAQDIAINGTPLGLDPRSGYFEVLDALNSADEIQEWVGILGDEIANAKEYGYGPDEIAIAKKLRNALKNNPASITLLERGISDVYAIFSGLESQIKSADPFTGVPLSQRFNARSDDIRFQSDTLSVDGFAEQIGLDEGGQQTYEDALAQRIAEVFGVSDEEAAGHAKLIDEVFRSYAEESKQPIADYYAKIGRMENRSDWAGVAVAEDGTLTQGDENAKAAVTFKDGQALIAKFKNGDTTSIAHEFFHIFDRVMPESMHAQLREAYGVETREAWENAENDIHEERAARDWEAYLMTGKAPTDALKRVFEMMRDAFARVYRSIRNIPQVTENTEAVKVFDRILGGPDSPTAPMHAPVGAEFDTNGMNQPGGAPAAQQDQSAMSGDRLEVRRAFLNLSTREGINELVKISLGEPGVAPASVYKPIGDKETVDAMNAYANNIGDINAANVVMGQGYTEPNGAHGTERSLTYSQEVTLAGVVLRRFSRGIEMLETRMENETDADTAQMLQQEIDRLNELSVDVAEYLSKRGTELGRGVKSFDWIYNLTPDGVVMLMERNRRKRLKKNPKSTRQDAEETFGESTDEIVEGLNEELQKAKKKAEKEIDNEADGLIERFRLLHNDLFSWIRQKPKAAKESLTRLLNQHIKEPISDFKEQAQGFGATEEQAALLDMIAGTERTRRLNIDVQGEPERIMAELESQLNPKEKEKINRPIRDAVRQYIAGDITWEAVEDVALKAESGKMNLPSRLKRLADARIKKNSELQKQRAQKRANESAEKLIERYNRDFSDTLDFKKNPKATTIAGLTRQYVKSQTDIDGKMDADDKLSAQKFRDELEKLGVEQSIIDRLLSRADEDIRRIGAIQQAKMIQAKESAVESFLNRLAGSTKQKRKLGPADKPFIKAIVDAHENGAIEREQFLDLYANKFGVALDRDTAKKIKKLAEKVEAAEDGFLKEHAARELLAEMGRLEGIATWDVLTAMWYANILSGVNTQGINLFGSGFHLGLRTLAAAIVTPRAALPMLRAMLSARTQRQARREAVATLRTGSGVVKGEAKYQAPGVLQMLSDMTDADNLPKWLQNKRTRKVIGLWDYVFRALQAGDGYFYRTALEGRAALAVTRAAAKKGLRGDALIREVDSQLYDMGMSDADAKAQAQADVEAVMPDAKAKDKKIAVERRMFEIMESNRPEDVRAESDHFGKIATFTQEPDGMLGTVAQSVNGMIDRVKFPAFKKVNGKWERSGEDSELRPLKFMIPFVNIVANVGNASLDFTPWGIMRAAIGKESGHVFSGREAEGHSTRRVEQAVASMVGTAATVALWGYADRFLDDEDPWFAIYAMGPDDTNKRRQKMSQGWKPFTFKVGDKYFKYNETSLGMMFSILGAIHDDYRYGKGKNERSLVEMANLYTIYAAKAFGEAGFLRSVKDTLDLATGDVSLTSTSKGILSVPGRIAKGAIPAQGLMRDMLTRPFDSTIIDTNSLKATMLRDIPWVQRLGTRPMLNALGEPVVRPFWDRVPIASRFVSGGTRDPKWNWLAKNGLWIPGDGSTVAVSLPGRGQSGKALLRRLQQKREENLGRVARDVLTDDETYEFKKRVGQEHAKVVETLMNRYPDMADDRQREFVQKQIRDSRTQIKSRVKQRMIFESVR